jgi:NitT/TauT family transport system substrate-binding protein
MIRDLKGKKVAIYAYGGADHVLMASMLAYVGMDPRKDVDWVIPEHDSNTVRLFVERKVDAMMGFPPYPQELRVQKVGHVIVNTVQDRPWSQYFCCMLVARREFTERYPNATKRALRAHLKAADLCSREPMQVADLLVSKGYEPRHAIALEVLKSLPYNRWQKGDPEDSLRFHALRLHEVGMIKTSPQKLIAQGTDWHFLNELKKELKA